MKDEILDILKSKLNILEDNICSLYLYGSKCYGTYTEESDYDINVITYNNIGNFEYSYNKYDLHILSKKHFEQLLLNNDIQALESILYNPKILEKHIFNFEINDHLFRKNVSSICSNSWVKAKKKILQNDILLGQKSLFHSIRIPIYAKQIKETNNIYDWQAANKYWDNIKEIEDWDILKSKYKNIKNKCMTDFRKLCPKK